MWKENWTDLKHCWKGNLDLERDRFWFYLSFCNMFWSDTELVQTDRATLISTELHPLKTFEKYHIQHIFLTRLSGVYFNQFKLFLLWEESPRVNNLAKLPSGFNAQRSVPVLQKTWKTIAMPDEFLLKKWYTGTNYVNAIRNTHEQNKLLKGIFLCCLQFQSKYLFKQVSYASYLPGRGKTEGQDKERAKPYL